ncbi:MAG: Fic family protein [Alphaproteobacteria bacterium]|nr:Fic family protein [Alphaproteobacteria bacterium]
MQRGRREENLQAIERVVRGHYEGVTMQEIAVALEAAPPRRTLQYRLKTLVDSGRLVMEGSGRWARYRAPALMLSELPDFLVLAEPARPLAGAVPEKPAAEAQPLSAAGAEILEYVRRPVAARQPVGYDPDFLFSYRPNESFYLSGDERAQLREAGRASVGEQPAGTYAKQILNRLLIDLSWNSSRLEGNTYSLLDTWRLIEAGEVAAGKDRRDAQMILNHKSAIEFLVDAAEDIGFDRYTILNLHAALADDLLPDPGAPGRLRRTGVGIHGSVFHPLEAPQLVEECFDRLLASAAAIEDPFEQAFFAMVQFPYLQAFDDVNKRVSRLAANIPLVRANLAPLSFEDVPRDLYTSAILGVYELRRVELLRDVFLWAYRRSAGRYAAVRQSLGEPDPLRLRRRTELRELVGEVIRGRMNKAEASVHVEAWTARHVDEPDRGRFCEIAQRELLSLHDGNFARYRVRPSEFAAWQEVWRG